MLLPPTRCSRPLRDDYRSDFDRFLPAFRVAWRASRGYVLDPWQEDLLRRIGELKDDGHLRYRQVLISLPRQQGKSELAAALGLWGLLRKRNALVIGIASSSEQARIIYERTQNIIRNTPALARRFDALTDTRGLRAKDGGRYEIKASKSAALQGLPIDLGIIDEVHLVKPALWSDLLNGTGSRDDCLIVGTTTAGDDSSELLKHLYSLAETGEGGESFGFFIWESPEARVPDDDDELAELLLAASPAYAAGRVPIENVIADVRSMPAADVCRYRLNRFVSSEGEFLPLSNWLSCETATMPSPPAEDVVFAIDVSPQWEFATVTASWKADGLMYTEVVASITRPTPERLVEVCVELADHSPRTFVMDSYHLKRVGTDLKGRGYSVTLASLSDVMSASAWFYATSVRKMVRHPGDPLLTVQLPAARRKNVGDAFRITRGSMATTIDALMATVLGIYFAEVLPDTAPQLY